MKKYAGILLVFLINLTFCKAQNPCNYSVGEVLYFSNSQSVFPIKSEPSIDGKIITTISGKGKWKSPITGNINTDSCRSHFSLVVVDENLINNFIKVKLQINDTSGIYKYWKFNDTICWVDRKLVMYSHILYSDGNDCIACWNKAIRELEILRIQNSCEYDEMNKNALAQCYQQRGIGNYDSANYSSAVFDLTKSIEISPTYKRIIKSYYFRAYAKMKLDDYTGAINDFEIAIKMCYEGKNNNDYNFPCKICSTENEQAVRISTGQESCYEYLVCQKAYCNIILKNYQTALTDLNLLISLYPKVGTAYFYRGQLKDMLNDTNGCCKDLSKAGELGITEAYDEIKKRCNK